MCIRDRPIAAEVAVAIVVAAAVMPVAAIRNSQHAIDGAHGTADTGTDRSANQTTHRTGGAVAFVGAFLRAAHDALRLSLIHI